MKFVFASFLFSISILFSGCSSEPNLSTDKTISTVKKQPNILFVMTDDHSRHAISAYGSKLVNTPNIDYIAKNGVLFNNCAVTNSICGPSRAVALTGKYSHINGFKDNRSKFDGSQQTFPKLLQKEGNGLPFFCPVLKWKENQH